MSKKLESKFSIQLRISACWGFYPNAIELLELGYHDGWCDHASFRVHGVGYSTDFKTIVTDPAFDEEAE